MGHATFKFIKLLTLYSPPIKYWFKLYFLFSILEL
ncbi:outer membrane receptor, mostly Fe transport domain protein, partial [Acinetobacter baumannii 25691_8]